MWQDTLKDSSKRIVNGLLFGLGFGIAVGAIYYVLTEKMMNSMWSDTASEKILITSHAEVKRADGADILGTIENRSDDSVRITSIQADLFDKDGKFVDQCSGYLSSSTKAGESRNFKISCGTKEKPIAEHASYKLRLGGM